MNRNITELQNTEVANILLPCPSKAVARSWLPFANVTRNGGDIQDSRQFSVIGQSGSSAGEGWQLTPRSRSGVSKGRMSALGEMAWVAGVVLAILAAVFGALGDNLIKLSYTKEDLAIERGEPPTKIWCRPLWYAGMTCLLVLNTACVIAALSISDASLTIPFGGLHICFNLVRHTLSLSPCGLFSSSLV